MASAMAPTSWGSTVRPASPTTSSVAVPADVTTGVACAIASRTGRPKPSWWLGKQKSDAPAWSGPRSAAGTNPNRRTPMPARRSTAASSSFQPARPPITRSTSDRPRRPKASISAGTFLRGSMVPFQNT